MDMGKQFWAPIGKRVVTTCKVGSVKAGAAGVVTWRDEAPRLGSMFKQRVAVRFDDYFPDYVIHEEDLASEPKPVRPGQFMKGGGRAVAPEPQPR